MGNKTKPPKTMKKDLATVVQGKSKTPTNHNCNIKCFRCPRNGYITLQYLSKRVMIMKEHGKTKFKSEKSKEDEMSPLEDCSDAEYSADEETLMIKRSLNV
jgi:hypothetical protein